ncbi:MAG: hypothetical protein R3284_00425 [Rubricoccaceae bacterium]|nr:hypothetical protein [Rubricoccaceae bacterium]
MLKTLFGSAATLLVVAFLSTGCSDRHAADSPSGRDLFSSADSLAHKIEQFAGGRAAFASVPVLRFDWRIENEGQTSFRASHLWDRRNGVHRVEYDVGPDSQLVAVFSVNDFDMEQPRGQVFVNGVSADSTSTSLLLAEAYERFINDSYWLLAPFKLFDDGVHRTMTPDSSDTDSSVLRLTFENVGLTPGDRYWIRADSSGRVMSWSYQLEGGGRGYYHWADYTPIPVAAGTLFVATRKQRGTRSILTEILPADSLDRGIFQDPRPRL